MVLALPGRKCEDAGVVIGAFMDYVAYCTIGLFLLQQ
jgi:hypothetical protein